MEKITEHECYGCMLCVSQCPVKAIEITGDQCGFLYPRIKSVECVNCGKCERLCIANHPPKPRQNLTKAYSASLKDMEALKKSASGGAGYALGISMINAGGIVYGVSYTGDYTNAFYKRVNNIEDLFFLQDTKYFHAEGKDQLYESVKIDLKSSN